MWEVFNRWIDAAALLPHGQTSLWQPDLLRLYVIGGGVIALAFIVIPIALWRFSSRRDDLRHRWLVVMFGVFIFGCAAIHLLRLWNIGHDAYWLETWITLITAAIASICAVAVWPVLPKLFALPSEDQYQDAYTQLLERHRQLTDSEDRFRVLIETAAEGVWMLDRNGVTTFANSAMCEMLRCLDGLQGRSVFEFVFDEDMDAAQERLSMRLAGDRQKREFRWRRADGSEVFTLISTSVLQAPNGSISGVMGLITDITDRVAMSAELQRLNLDLGQRVEARTRELEESNRELAREIVVREYVQTELAASNERLNHYLSELQRFSDDLSRVNELGDQLHACDNRRELIQVLQRSCLDLFAVSGGALFEVHEDRLQLLEFGWGDCAGLEGSFHRDQCRASPTGQPFPGNAVEQEGTVCVHRPSLMPALCVPLHSRGVQVGLLLLQRPQPFWSGQDAADREMTQLIRALSEHTALALDNLSLRESLRAQSLSDSLTGLFNRRYLFEQMEREMIRFERDQRRFALLLIDIDHFKMFNDRYGHAVGDAVLVQVSQLLREYTRRSDLACRLGGEEFVVLLDGVELEQAMRRADAIREAVKKLSIEGVADVISISAGVAIYPDHGEDAHGLLRAADQALYASKRGGRDRISVAG